MKKHIVRLSSLERESLKKLITSGRGPARMFTRARILLKADQSDEGPGWSDERISEALEVTVQTIERVRKQLVEEGFDAVLARREYKQKRSRKKIDGDVEARLIALSCGDPPKGRARWTLRLLAETVVELGYVENISHEAIRQTLKKTNLSRGGSSNGVFHQKPMPPLFAQWRMSLKFTNDLIIQNSHLSAWMKQASN